MASNKQQQDLPQTNSISQQLAQQLEAAGECKLRLKFSIQIVFVFFFQLMKKKFRSMPLL
jgi:hypothetical protein